MDLRNERCLILDGWTRRGKSVRLKEEKARMVGRKIVAPSD